MGEITKSKLLSDEPSIYIQNAIATDPTVAPKGKSTLYVLVPVPNNTSNIDWENITPKFRDMILNMVSEKLGIEDIRPFIEEERVISPARWEKEIGVYKGATFNFGHQLTQMASRWRHTSRKWLANHFRISTYYGKRYITTR